MEKSIYVLGKPTYKMGVQWEVLGIFDSFEKAFAAHTNNNQFIGIAEINKTLPNKFQPWPNCKFIYEHTVAGCVG